MTISSPQRELAEIVARLGALGKSFAVVGGLAVSVRAEVRFTRDVDIAVVVENDTDAETLVFELTRCGYTALATVEHETQGRLSTARLSSPLGVIVDLMFASSGLEREIVDRATEIVVEGIGGIRVARAEELLSMKVLSTSPTRLQDTIDAHNLIAFNPDLRIDEVRQNLTTIIKRGFSRGENLMAKLDSILQSASSQ